MIILCSTNEKAIERWTNCLETLDDLSICSDAHQFLETTSKHRDALVLLHLSFPQMTNNAVIASFIENSPQKKVIACADIPNDEQGLELLKIGIYGYCNTWISADQLKRVIEQVKAGEVWVGRTLILKLINNLSAASKAGTEPMTSDWLKGLTQREHEVAELVGQGASNKVIANQLDITERTAKAHLSAIFRKTGCKDRIQLALQINQTTPSFYSKLGS